MRAAELGRLVAAVCLGALTAGAPTSMRAQTSAIVSAGADSLESVVRSWADAYLVAHPDTSFELEALGSSTGPPALRARRAHVAPMTRPMRPSELAACRETLGSEPIGFTVGVDAAVVFVQRDNPVEGLSLPQLDAIFSRSRSCSGGAGEEISTWADVGVVERRWARQRIIACGPRSSSGAHDLFRERVLCGGAFRDDLREQPGQASVLRWIEEGFCGVAFGGLGGRARLAEGSRILPLATEPGAPFVEPTPAALYAGTYPLHRLVYLYVAPGRDGAIPAHVEQFVRYALSPSGQVKVRQSGLFPLPDELRLEQLERLRAPRPGVTPPAR